MHIYHYTHRVHSCDAYWRVTQCHGAYETVVPLSDVRAFLICVTVLHDALKVKGKKGKRKKLEHISQKMSSPWSNEGLHTHI